MRARSTRGATVTVTDAQWDTVFPAGPSVVTTVKTATAKDGLTVAAAATNLGEIPGAYVALIEAGTEADVSADGGFLAMQWAQKVTSEPSPVDLATAAKNLDRTKSYEVIVWKQHSNPDASTIYARSGVTITSAQWDALFDVEVPEVPETTGHADDPGCERSRAAPSAGRSPRRSRTTSRAISPRARSRSPTGLTRSGRQFQFGQTVGGDFDITTGLGSVVYRGSVRFTGHQGVLDVTVSNPQIPHHVREPCDAVRHERRCAGAVRDPRPLECGAHRGQRCG